MLLSSPHRALLPGRTRWLELCHAQPAGCPACLAAIARFLAEETRWELAAALDRPAESYAAEFNPHRCTLDQARDLRRLTVQACVVHAHELAGIPIVSVLSFVVADSDFAEAIAS